MVVEEMDGGVTKPVYSSLRHAFFFFLTWWCCRLFLLQASVVLLLMLEAEVALNTTPNNKHTSREVDRPNLTPN